MSDEPTGASLNAIERGVLSRITEDSAACEVLGRLEAAGCEREDLIRLLTAGITTRMFYEGRFARGGPWGLSDRSMRLLPRTMRNLADQLTVLHQSGLGKLDHLRGHLGSHPANETLPPELRAGGDLMIGVVESLPVVLKWYAAYLERWRLHGRKGRSSLLRFAAEFAESAVSALVKNQTGGPHWHEVSTLLTAAYDSVTKGKTLKGKKKAGDSATLYDVENLRKRVARLNKEAAAVAGAQTAEARPDKVRWKKAPGKSGTSKR